MVLCRNVKTGRGGGLARFGPLLLLAIALCAGPGGTDANTVKQYLQSAREADKQANRLVHESSPYLLQHAYNPVHWYPWGEAAFTAAREQNKPIFLSIGYSTCHWCHVMARESFENEAIAKILNEHFISIKVDREERPDIDRVYMLASEIINGYGGWPLTVFLNHELQPFHAGTYYPPETVGNHQGLKSLLLKITELWRENRDQVDQRAARLTDEIGLMMQPSTSQQTLGVAIDDQAVQAMREQFDHEYGGFGSAPKFPRPGGYLYLSRLAESKNDQAKQAAAMLHATLKAIAAGGIYDQLGGGFHRYSVDAAWRVPHFEKMLYSQALLSLAYTKAWQLDQHVLYKNVVEQTLDFVVSEMASQQGGFYSALGADSERADGKGEVTEGAYYLWRYEELEKILTEKQWRLVRDYYSIEKNGNIFSDPNNEFGERNLLYVNEDFRDKKLTAGQQKLLDAARQTLLGARKQRPRPLLDDKIITAWNGMMITALARACTVFNRPDYCQAAQRAAGFIEKTLVNSKTGEVLRRYRNGDAGIAGVLDDYVWAARAWLTLYAIDHDREHLQQAIRITEQQQHLFYDDRRGGYYSSTGDDTSVLFRAREVHDGATVAASAVAVANLVDLAQYTTDSDWLQPARASVNAFAAEIEFNPAASAMLLYTSFPLRHSEKTP